MPTERTYIYTKGVCPKCKTEQDIIAMLRGDPNKIETYGMEVHDNPNGDEDFGANFCLAQIWDKPLTLSGKISIYD